MSKLGVFHRFLLVLSLSTIFAVLSLAGTLSYLLGKNILEEEARDTARLVRMITGVDLSAEKFVQAAQEKEGSLFQQLADRLILLPEVIRVKIYGPEGTLVWSDEKRLIGRNFPDNRELKESLRGKVQVAMGLLKAEHVFERESYDERRLLEIYVPMLHPETGDVYAVLEIYKHPVSHFALIDRMHRLVWTISLLVGFLLFASCSWLFWDAMKRQQKLDSEKKVIHAQLIHADRLASVGEMFAGLAHEINNPLNFIMTKVRLVLKHLQDLAPRSELVEDLRVIDKHILRIAGIVRSLLAFSRKSNAEMVRLDLNDIIIDCVTLVEKPFAEMKITFDQSLASGLPKILGDANQIQQVFLNLLSNARDAMDGGGRISVRTYGTNHNGARVVAQIRDTGQGIPVEILGKIFDPFFTTKKTREGAGLGLAVAYAIVSSHRGTIHVDSRPGEGAVFTLSFPEMTEA